MANVITATIAHRSITTDAQDREPLVSGLAGKDLVRFETGDSEWSPGYTYAVTFACGDVAVTMDSTKVDGTGDPIAVTESGGTYSTQEIEVPTEVLVPGSLRLTLRGFNESGTEVINTAHMRTGIGVKSRGATNGTEAHEATKDIVQECIDATGAANEAVEEVASDWSAEKAEIQSEWASQKASIDAGWAAEKAEVDEATESANDAAARAEAAATAKFPVFSFDAPDVYVDVPKDGNYSFDLDSGYLEVVVND